MFLERVSSASRARTFRTIASISDWPLPFSASIHSLEIHGDTKGHSGRDEVDPSAAIPVVDS